MNWVSMPTPLSLAYAGRRNRAPASRLRRLIGALLAVTASGATVNAAADFELREHLGHSWANECVTFALTPTQIESTDRGRALVGSDGRQVPYQVSAAEDARGKRICFQADLPSLESREYRFTNAKAAASSDLKIQETATEIRIQNAFIGVAIRRFLRDAKAPISGIRLRSGAWVGDSALREAPAIKSYAAQVTARGPVFVEARCRTVFQDGGRWDLRFRIERGEPVALIEEDFDAPGGGTFAVALGGRGFRPGKLLFRAGKYPHIGKVMSAKVATGGTVFDLEPWLHWWFAERRGNWFALYTAGQPDMLAVGALRPSVWKDPQWKGKAKHVPAHVRATAENGLVSLGLPLGGGRRRWMLCTPDKAKGVEALSQRKRNVAPPPQQYLIKHGDFPLDEV